MVENYPLFAQIIEWIGLSLDGFGVGVILMGALGSVGRFLWGRKGADLSDAYRQLRENLGRTILLGLEFLVAGDIIRTVAVSPTYRSVGLLGIIIAIRFFLSMQLEVEINGRFPWQHQAVPSDSQRK
ncbi:MAG: DUF1622 domain-containing protein [Deltaproteobacteria bacterium]|nr:DUF1622 domain-containing protein [Deltaproteobacteria bacterium]